MSTTKPRKIDEDAGRLYDFAAARPDGFTFDDVHAEFGWERSYFSRVSRRVRIIFAEDEINLVCTPQGKCEKWKYELVGNYAAALPWQANRLGDLESRLETVHAVAASIVKGTDGRSTEGRKAKKIEVGVRHLMEQLDQIDVA